MLKKYNKLGNILKFDAKPYRVHLRKSAISNGVKKILIINVNWLGDVLFSTPFIQTIRNNFPESFIACMLVPRTRAMLEGNPAIDEIIIFDEDGLHQNLIGKLKLIKLLRARKFDLVFLLHRSFTRTLIAFLAGIPQRIGYYTKKRFFLLTKAIEPPEEEKHKVEYFLDIARNLGLKVERLNYQFFISPQDKAFAQELLGKEGIADGNFVVINPGGNWLLKRWPKENFACLIDALSDGSSAKIVITGGKGDIKLAQEIASLSKNKPIVLCGKTNLKQLGAVLERAKLVIANDSGPMHLAASLKVPLIALFGPTSPLITGPYTDQANCIVLHKRIGCLIPCYNLSCSDNRCLKAISVEEVAAEAKLLFKK